MPNHYSIYTSWLPDQVAAEARSKEPARFSAAVANLVKAVQFSQEQAAAGNRNAWAAVLGQQLDDVKTLVSTKTVFAASDVKCLISTLYDVVLATVQDVEVQVRAGECLNHVLRHHRHSQHLGLQLPWRPLYDMLQQLYDNPPPQLRGTFLDHVQQSTLFTLVARARRFFAPGAAAEIYTLLRPSLVCGDPMAASTQVALGWLVLFFPTKQLPHSAPGEADVWVCEWLGVWGRLTNCSYWDNHWMYLLARAVKDDWRGVVDWLPHIPVLYTHMLACFKVPVGTATAGCPISIGAQHKALTLFGNKLDQVDDQPKSAAKLAVHLLKQPQAAAAAAAAKANAGLARMLSLGLGTVDAASGVQVQGLLHSRGHEQQQSAQGNAGDGSTLRGEGLDEAAAAGEDVVMTAAVSASADALDSLVQLLEQYCHPSNTGGWSSDLAVFLRHGVHYFMKVLGRQCGSAGWPGEQVLVAAAAKRYIRAAVKLAARGQFSKKDSLVSASCKTLCHLSYVWPGAVLPLVLGRFQSALATATAMHQLPTAITSLAQCVRPLLLAGWHTDEESTPQVIAEAMMAVLPGIDANDEAKTAAVFQFYTAVLSSIPALHGLGDEDDDVSAAIGGDAGFDLPTSPRAAMHVDGAVDLGGGRRPGPVYRLPLYLEDWVDQVMERLFTLLNNLDTGPSHRGTDQQAKPELLLQSTHLGKDTMYHSFFQHLLLRLPPSLADHVVSLLGHFATGTALPTVALEASSMFRSAGISRPLAAVEHIIKPLIAKIQAELPEPGGSSSSHSLSRSLEDSLTWHLVLLGSSVGGLAPHHVAPLVPQLEQLVDHTLQLSSRVAHNWASMVLSSMLGSLSGWYFPDQTWAQTGGLLLPNGLQLWIDRQGVGWTAPRWALPDEQHVAIAARLADKYLEGAAQQLEQLCSGGGSSGSSATASGGETDSLEFKTKCRGLLAAIAATIIGLMSRLRDFQGFVNTYTASSSSNSSAQLQAMDGPDADWADGLQLVGGCASPLGAAGVRNRVAAALTVAIRHLRGGDRDLLEQVSYTSLLLMCPGMLEQALGGQGRHGGKDDGAIIDEPAAATAFLLAASAASCSSPSSNDVGDPNSSGTANGNFVQAFRQSVQKSQEQAAAEEAAAVAGSSGGARGGSAPGPGSWNSEWRWRRRTSPLAVVDRLRRMLLWRCAQAASKAGPPLAPGSTVSAADAAAGLSVTPAGAVKLQQLPMEYVALFSELLVLSMQPNAGVRGSAMPTLQSCIKRFPCLVEVMLPEVLAALAGVEGPLLHSPKKFPQQGSAVVQGLGASAGLPMPGSKAAGQLQPDVVDTERGVVIQLPTSDQLERFYGVTLIDAMKSEKADAADAAGSSTAQVTAAAGGAAAAAAALTAAAAAAKAATGMDSSTAAAAVTAAAAAGAAAGSSRSVAAESVNDGRVAGACAVLAQSLDAWRAIFRDQLVFRAFVAALMASRCHSSNTCLKNIQMLIMQVISRFKLPPLLSVDGAEYSQLQTQLMSLAEPGARVTWRYAVLSNMVLMFAAPPADTAAAVTLLRHCVGLLQSDMLLLRQVGGAGLWLLLVQVADHEVVSPELVDVLRQALGVPEVGETLVKLLVLDHAKLDASEAAKAARGGGGGLGGVGGVLSGLLGMTAEEVMGAMVAAAVERYDRWPAGGGRPTATTDGLFEISHARLIRLMGMLCPRELLEVLQAPLTVRLTQYSAPSGPTEKAELATVIECLSGLLAAAAPARAAAAGAETGSTGGSAAVGAGFRWPLALLRRALGSSTLEMSDAWGAALWYILDHLLMTTAVDPAVAAAAAAAAANSGCSNGAGGGGGVMEIETEDGPSEGAAAAAAAAAAAGICLQQILDVVRHLGSTTAAAAAAAEDAAATASSPGAQPVTAAAAGAGSLPLELKRMKYMLHCLPAMRKQGTLGVVGADWQPSGTSCHQQQQQQQQWVRVAEPIKLMQPLPKAVRVFLAAFMHEVRGYMESEQPSAMREVVGGAVGDLAGLFAAPDPILLPSAVAAAAAAVASQSQCKALAPDVGAAAADGSGCSSPVEVEVPVSVGLAAGSHGDLSLLQPEVLLLNSSLPGLRAQAKQLLDHTVSTFLLHAARLATLKNSGSSSATGSSSNLAARGSDNSDDIVMVEAAGAADAPVARQSQPQAAGSLSRADPASLARSLSPCGISLQALLSAFESGEAASLKMLLTSMLPGVLQLQELSGPGLQQLASEAKSCFVMYKYLPLSAGAVPGVAGSVLVAGGSDAWSTRAAAVVFLQCFWFRHCYLLDAADLGQLQAFVVSLLQDPKVEVRSLAADTLSGIIKALPGHEIEGLRAGLMAKVAQLFASQPGTASKRHKKTAAAAPSAAARAGAGSFPVVAAAAASAAGNEQQLQGPGFLVEAQAVVQGLKAFVLSAPYDVPPWMPEVLMGLVAAANSRNPLVRRDASKVLSEFKRTHEEDALEQLRQQLGEEQWEAVSQVTSSASYFV